MDATVQRAFLLAASDSAAASAAAHACTTAGTGARAASSRARDPSTSPTHATATRRSLVNVAKECVVERHQVQRRVSGSAGGDSSIGTTCEFARVAKECATNECTE